MLSFIVGKKASGKTYWMREYLTTSKKPYIVIDPLREYPAEHYTSDVYEIVDLLQTGNYSSISYTAEFDNDSEALFYACFHATPHLLVIEEFHLYASVHKTSRPLQRLLRMGRHKGIDIVGITQRIRDLPQLVVTQADQLLIFRQQGLRDQEYLDALLEKGFGAKASRLNVGEFIRYVF